MNELKHEDVVRELEAWIYDFKGTATQFCALCDAITLLREKDATLEMCAETIERQDKELAKKDAEIERLKNSITFQVTMPDEKMEEIKNECLERVELGVKAAKDKLAEETIEWCRKKLKFGKYQTIGLSGKRLEGYEAAMKAVMSYMHSLKSKDDFPNCKISGCEAARKDCHLGCPYGKENTSENS